MGQMTDLERLEAIRLWCREHYVKRVVIDGIELELAPEAFYVTDPTTVTHALTQTQTIGHPLSLHERVRREAMKEPKDE
jgi:hypothetical protein